MSVTPDEESERDRLLARMDDLAARIQATVDSPERDELLAVLAAFRELAASVK
jgi:hypothetical protein